MERVLEQLVKEWTMYAMANGGDALGFTRALLHCAYQLSVAIKDPTSILPAQGR